MGDHSPQKRSHSLDMDTDSAGANTAPFISGYTIAEQLSEGARTRVYRALRSEHPLPVILKVLRNKHPSLGELIKFRNQYTITRNLDHAKIVRPLALERCGNGYVLVMPDEGFVALSTYLQRRKLSLSTTLTIAIQLAEVLHYLTQQRIIHKDIKPGNILIHPATEQIQLIDFSIASLLPKERQQLANPNVLEGTLAYISPEQTGRMNRDIDYRTDFYSLGVTLFELLTGELPFAVADPMELVYCHIAHPAAFPETSQRTIPERVQAVVLKLMAKNAEDRYQSALGLKHDLEICLRRWEATGHISAFELGKRDRCDRFLIPEKLYGRDQEVRTLLTAFERVTRGSTELLLVVGFSGIGKTAVINEVHKPITHRHGYFIRGKFDQFNRNIPFSAIVQALQDLIGQLLAESDTCLVEWRTQLLEAVGESGQVLVEIMPELEQLIGQQPPAPALSGIAAQNRFNWLFQKLIAVFTTAEHPLVIFLDDLQWADLASLQLIKLLMSNQGHLLLLGAYRDNEVSPGHPVLLAVDELQKTGKAVQTIALSPLTSQDTHQLVANALGCPNEHAHLLTELMERRTQGNPFFITQFLKALYEEGYITFNRDRGCWECDVAQVDMPFFTDDVVTFMVQQLQRLPSTTQQVLALAACLGSQFNLATLAAIAEQSKTETATRVWKAIQEGLILPVSETYKFFQDPRLKNSPQTISVPYRFLHDRVQQAAYNLIPQPEQASTHLKIARCLLAHLSKPEVDHYLFDIASNISLGKGLITDPDEKHKFARLLLKAAQKAKITTAYTAAAQYCQDGIAILGEESWRVQKALIQEFHEIGAEVAYLNGNFEQTEALIDCVLEKNPVLLEQIKSYEIKIQAYIIQNRTLEALQTGLKVLSKLGTHFPHQPNLVSIGLGFLKTKLLLRGRPVASLASASTMEHPLIEAKSSIIKALHSAAYISKQKLYPLLIFKHLELLLGYGNNDIAALVYCSYGLILNGLWGDIETGYQFGELALELVDRPNAKTLETGVRFTVYAFIKPWKRPLKESVPVFFENYHRAVAIGDNEHAAWSILTYLRNARSSGMDLNENAKQHAVYINKFTETQQSAVLSYAYPSYWLTLNLLGQKPFDGYDDQALEESNLINFLTEANDRVGLFSIYLYRLMFAYWIGDFEFALESAALTQKYVDSVISFYEVQQYWWFASLTWLAINAQVPNRRQFWKQIQQGRQKLKKWAQHAPMNALHKFYLVEAERCRVLKQREAAANFYDRAISAAQDSGYIQEEALANELAAKFYLEWGKEKAVEGYMQAAYYGYAHWGAKAKTDDLEKSYSSLLRSPLQSSMVSPLETLATIAAPNLSAHTSTNINHALGNQLNTALDFAAVLKASQTLAKSIQIDELLHQLTQIILQNSGGDRCALLLLDGVQNWQLRAISTPKKTELCSENLDGNLNLPVKLIQYVKNTQQVVLINELDTDLPVIDEHLNQQQPRSLLCLPILNQGRLMGLLYLRNQSTSGVFTHDRILVVNFLCTQAAIALENAQLYQQAQTYASQLEQSQLQIVQSEKMSALGNLVAGVAHEVNNPIGFVSGNLTELKLNIADLLEHLKFYKQHAPAEKIQKHAKKIELSYLLEDIPKMLTSMSAGCDRIRDISVSLRMFSRADSETKSKASLHEGIDSTLLILKYRLKAKNSRPEIEVVRDYGELPEFEYFPGQLNQALMNILANAIDMFDEMAEEQSFNELQANPQRITIQTRFVENCYIEIRIRDNGKGMSEEVCARIFDRKFTTKEIGKGTGLGLAITHQVIVEKHGGSLEVQSEIGKGTEFLIRLPV